VVAQKLERPTPSGVKWDVHRFEFDDGELKLVDDERPPDDRQRWDSTTTGGSSE
jgi:hypothetical protein